MPSFDGRPIAETIVVHKLKKNSTTEVPQGKRFIGTIKSIVEFGIFVGLDGHPDALLHKTKIPENMRGDLNNSFHKGERISVEVAAVTEKGIQLKYVSNATVK